MGGSTKKVSTAPQETAGLRQGVMGYLMGGPPTTAQTATQGSGSFFGKIKNQIQQKNQGSPVQGMVQGGPQLAGGVAGLASQGGMFGSTVTPVQQPASPYDRMNAQMPTLIQGVDQMGGAASPFMQNMMAQMQPMFTQQRNEAMAAAREGAGNLTGSGFGNILGGAINRSLGNEQAMAADFARQGLGMEMQRQQANMQTQAQLADANAARYANLLGGMSMAGLGPDQIVKSGGIGSVLGPIAGIAGTFLGGPAGGVIANTLFGGRGGGGGVPNMAGFNPYNSMSGR